MLRKSTDAGTSPDVGFYRAQLNELDRDVTRGVIDPPEAERSRIEIARRLLAADKAADQAPTDRPAPLFATLIIAAVSAAGLYGYWSLGAPGYPDLPLKARLEAADQMRATRPTQDAMAAAALAPPAADVPASYLESVEQLRKIVPTRPDDLQGWELLVKHERQLRNFSAAAFAQDKVMTLKGSDATAQDTRVLLDLMVAAADGLVSPEAEVLVRQLLEQDADDTTGRYYLGALYNQTDRPDIALRIWRPLVADGDATRFHVAAARAQIEDAAHRAGVTYNLPEARGPSADDIANAEGLSEAERTDMIASMVAGLSDRLATQGGPASDWARLIRAYGVLGQTDAATEIWLEAAEVFGGSEGAVDQLRAAAIAAGVTP